MAKPDPNVAAHLEWIGFVAPTGLVVSAPALDRAGAVLDRRDVEGQRLLRECAGEHCFASREEPQPWLPDFRAFASSVLGWSFSPKGYAGTEEAPIPAELEAALPDAGGILRPDFAVRATPLRAAPATEASPTSDAPAWQLLVRVCEPGGDFDRAARAGDGLEASPQARMERLLRHTGVPAGLLFNGLALRLISAPRGESSGWLDFRVADMIRTAGRPICTALRLLLNQRRLLSLPRPQRFAALLEDSRKYQNEVSERLAQQVLHALHELLSGFQAAHDLSGRKLLEQPLEDGPDDVYRALLTLVLRLVFLLYAEERDMLPQDATFLHAYSLAALHARLREDAALHPDTMDQRYGAYAQLLILFRMVHDGARSGAMTLPPRQGALFDPDRYCFLEGRGGSGARQIHERIEPPLVPDGTICRVLEKLLVLDGERISYRALDVKHIGSVYETMMGFRLETATGRAAAVRAAKKHGAPATVDVEALLREAPADRAGWIQDRTDRKLTDRVKQAVRDADTVDALHAALDPVIDRNATPDLVPEDAMVLQPSAERRRSGSHYTPRELTEQIVRTALEPIFRREAGEDVSDQERRLWWRNARDELDTAGVYGDLVLAAFFEKAKAKEREALRVRIADAVVRGETHRYRSWLSELRDAEPPLAPFHWEIEFPEVFERDNPGFDAVVGNPPFAGKNTVAAANVAGYPDWLKQVHAGSHGNADQVAHFFRRAFDLVRRDGACGLIATNTIAQGDTRSTGLRWICTHGGEIYRARRRVPWPGLAAVVVSVLHVHKGPFTGVRRLDDAVTDRITAFLFHRGGHDDPARLEANAGKSFVGSYVLGMGFTFDDTDKKGVATPLAEMRRLIEENPRNREVIFPYIGGEEVNTSPTHAHHRYVINFRDWPSRRDDLGEPWAGAADDRRREWLRRGIVPLDYPDPVAADWPDLLEIVEERAKPGRMKLGDNGDARRRKEKWWLWGRYTPALFAAIDGLERVLAISRIGNAFAFTFLPQEMVYNEKTVVFPFSKTGAFATLQSRIHEVWTRFFSSTLKDDLQYTPSDCFGTFPFPDGWERRRGLDDAGGSYHDFRAELMERHGEGLTKTYNRFHDPHENASEIMTLRSLHAAMDRAVLDAYGWRDIPTDCEFLLDYEIDKEEWGPRKKPWRYRWPDDIRDDVLARLLELNAQRAAEEMHAGMAATTSLEKPRRSPTRLVRRESRAARAAEPRFRWGADE